MEQFYGFFPAKILSIADNKKTVQVSVDPYTNGAENGITAKLAYPVGFNDKDTELQIIGQPDVWVFFEGGQFKNPVVAFFRTHQTGSETGIFRLRHKKLEFYADSMGFYAKNILFDADTHTTGDATSDGDQIAGGVSQIKHNHGGVRSGEGFTLPPTASAAKTAKVATMADSLASVEQDNSSGTTQEASQLKVWQGTVNAQNTWTCDYSSAGFTEKPMLWANGVPLKGLPILATVDSENATETQCSGFAFSNVLDTSTGQLSTPSCTVHVYAMGK